MPIFESLKRREKSPWFVMVTEFVRARPINAKKTLTNFFVPLALQLASVFGLVYIVNYFRNVDNP